MNNKDCIWRTLLALQLMQTCLGNFSLSLGVKMLLSLITELIIID